MVWKRTHWLACVISATFRRQIFRPPDQCQHRNMRCALIQSWVISDEVPIASSTSEMEAVNQTCDGCCARLAASATRVRLSALSRVPQRNESDGILFWIPGRSIQARERVIHGELWAVERLSEMACLHFYGQARTSKCSYAVKKPRGSSGPKYGPVFCAIFDLGT